MKHFKRWVAIASSAATLCAALTVPMAIQTPVADAATANIEDQMNFGTLGIAGGGFVSGIITGENTMYARTDVGGAYKYNYETGNWDQIIGFLNDADRGYLSVDAMCIDPNDEDTVFLLCGCAYFTDAKTQIFISHDGCETFERVDVTDMIQVMGNGHGRQFGEAIAVDPDDSNVIYCGGDVTAGDSALIKSTDGGKTWKPVMGYDDLGLYKNTVKYPTWTDHIARCITDGSYETHNGVGTINIKDGKVYVGSSVKGQTNIHVASVKDDKFEALSADLPTEYFPSRVNEDADGNFLISYVGSLTFSGGGCICKYDTKTGKVTDITPTDAQGNKTSHAYGAAFSDPNDANKLVATSCDFSYSQMWTADAWETDSVVWGSQLYRSTDGGATWESITPGNTKTWGGPLQADYLQDGGRPWVRGFSIHWSGAMVLDPRDPNRFLVTSGNGVFACDNTWDELPVVYFEADGIEEVVSLDMVSVPGGNPISVIGDYDGFIHYDNEKSERLDPSMGKITDGSASTGAIAYCPQNPDVMVRCAENHGVGYYTTDGGKTWTETKFPVGGKAAITQLEDGSYRILKSESGSTTAVNYSDDFGATWNKCSGIDTAYGSKPTNMFVEWNDPSIVYAYATYFNSSWHYSKTEPDLSDAAYKLYVSHDYGATFTKAADVAMYDMCDSAGRIAYLGDGELVLAAGWYGAYHVTDYGKNIEKLDTVSYCKTMGFGAPAKEGGVNTLFMYGKPSDSDPEGIYRSTDAGQTWVAINLTHLYGGTGNGNYLVGDMNKFGTVYMSTVGCGIVFSELADEDAVPPVDPATTTTTPEETTTTTTTITANPNLFYGDVDLDGRITESDYDVLEEALNNGLMNLNQMQIAQADVSLNGRVDADDLGVLRHYLDGVISVLPFDPNGEAPTTTTTVTTITTPAEGTTVADPVETVLLGDVDMDGIISLSDVVYLNKNTSKLSDAQRNVADCYGDGIIDVKDGQALMKYVVGIVRTLPMQPTE